MNRENNVQTRAVSRRIALWTVFIGMLAVAGLTAWTSRRVSANDPQVLRGQVVQTNNCEGCGIEKVPRTGNAELDAQAVAVAQAHPGTAAAYQGCVREKFLRDMKTWKGTKVFPADSIPENHRKVYESFAANLVKYSPSPEERTAIFAAVLRRIDRVRLCRLEYASQRDCSK